MAVKPGNADLTALFCAKTEMGRECIIRALKAAFEGEIALSKRQSPFEKPGISGKGESRPYMLSWKVRLITSSCCSRERRLKFTA